MPCVSVEASKSIIHHHHAFATSRRHDAVLTIFETDETIIFGIINAIFVVNVRCSLAQIEVDSPHRVLFVRQQQRFIHRPCTQRLAVAHNTKCFIFSQKRSLHSKSVSISLIVITRARSIIFFQQHINERSSHERIFHSRYTIPSINQQHSVNTRFGHHRTRSAPLFSHSAIIVIFQDILILQFLSLSSRNLKFEPPLLVVREVHRKRFSRIVISKFWDITHHIELLPPRSTIIYTK